MPEEAKCQLVINMPREQAWEKLKDLSLAHNYVPGLVKTEITTSEKTGIGASRKVYQTQTKGINETVTEQEFGASTTHCLPPERCVKTCFFSSQ